MIPSCEALVAPDLRKEDEEERRVHVTSSEVHSVRARRWIAVRSQYATTPSNREGGSEVGIEIWGVCSVLI